jgi:hypothetical protein
MNFSRDWLKFFRLKLNIFDRVNFLEIDVLSEFLPGILLIFLKRVKRGLRGQLGTENGAKLVVT